MPAIHFRFFA